MFTSGTKCRPIYISDDETLEKGRSEEKEVEEPNTSIIHTTLIKQSRRTKLLLGTVPQHALAPYSLSADSPITQNNRIPNVDSSNDQSFASLDTWFNDSNEDVREVSDPGTTPDATQISTDTDISNTEDSPHLYTSSNCAGDTKFCGVEASQDGTDSDHNTMPCDDTTSENDHASDNVLSLDDASSDIDSTEEYGGDQEEQEEEEEGEPLEQSPPSRRMRSKRVIIGNDAGNLREEFCRRLRMSESLIDQNLLYPPSLWDNRIGSSAAVTRGLLDSIFDEGSQSEDTSFLERGIDEFCAYNGLDHDKFPGQYEALHTVASEQEKKTYLLDGIVNHNGKRIILRGAEIKRVSIGGLDLNHHSCGDQLWLQTKNSPVDGWFKLGRPSPQYKTFWRDFLWIANLAKYCIDYLTHAEEVNRQVSLDDFRSDFIDHITMSHDIDKEFRSWRGRIKNNKDIRRHITQYGWFIRDQVYIIARGDHWMRHPLWNDIGYLEPVGCSGVEKTIVTHNIASTFLIKFPEWGRKRFDLLKQIDWVSEVEAIRNERLKLLQIPLKFETPRNHDYRDIEQSSLVERTLAQAAKENRTVDCPAEKLENKLVVVRQSQIVRRDQAPKHFFDFALVLSISNNKKQARIAWLTLPSNTICAGPKPENCKNKARYPITNELFFSDDCNCFTIHLADVVGVYNISILEDFSNRKSDFFAVTKYIESEQCFVKTTRPEINFMCREMCQTPKNRLASSLINTTDRRRRGKITPVSSTQPKPSSHLPKLSNLSLFTGCGMLDRALEANGHLNTSLSIDISAAAICSARANRHIAFDNQQEFVVGSVNEQLRKIMTGERRYPDVGCMSAGCPCPGFSRANMNPNNKESARDRTLLASTMSWIETILPAYVVIENVLGMDDQRFNACSQAISFLVALGYQVRKVRLKASDFGGCTSRERLFILATVPAYELPDAPRPTHGRQDNLLSEFTVRDAVENLPAVHNDTLINVEDPYHIPIYRISANVTKNDPNLRDLVQRIPKTPYEQGLASSFTLLSQGQQEWARSYHPSKLAPTSKSIKRVNPDGFFCTVVTVITWLCSLMGQVIHPEQDRVLTLEEMARAQGVPHNFVLVGTPAEKLRQIGNAVPRCLREAIGRAVGEAYFRSKPVALQLISEIKQEATCERTAIAKIPMEALHITPSSQAKNYDDNDDVISSDRSTYQRALERRLRDVSITTASGHTTISSTRESMHPDSDGRCYHNGVTTPPPNILNSIETASPGQTSLTTPSHRRNHLRVMTRQSTQAQKRTRSTDDDDSDMDRRSVKRQARLRTLEEEMKAVGASAERSDCDDDEITKEGSGSLE